jgi:D-threo-aldose 1-dehydrogenase
VLAAAASQPARVGRTALTVTRLGFGRAPLGGLLRATSSEDAQAAVHAALAAGIRHFDVAPQYGGGLAERRLGEALREVPRERVVVSTKVGKRIELLAGDAPTQARGFEGAPPHAIRYDYSYDGALRSLDESRARLGMARIDIAFVHDVNRKYHGEAVMRRLDEALAGACRALRRLRDEGAIGAFGCALNEVDVALRFVEEADVDCIMLPQRFTLLDRSAAAALMPRCLERGVAGGVAAPFDSGILATGTAAHATYNYAPAPAAVQARVRAMEQLCARHGVPLHAAALQFPLRHAAVASVVAGMRSRDEVERNVAAMAMPLAEGFWAELEEARSAAGE